MNKKWVIGLAAALMIGVMSGCGSDKEGTEKNSTESVNQEKSERINVSDYNVDDYVTLGDYSNIEVTVAAPQVVTDEEVDAQALAAYQSYTTKENGGIVDRAVAEGDTVIIDYVGKKDGVAFAGGTAQGANLTIGSGQFIDGFEDGLIGVKPGETVDLNLTFPKNYDNTDLAGAKVVFTVTVHFILPVEMKDEVVDGFGLEECRNVEELKQYCRTVLEQNAQNVYQQNLMEAAISVLAENSSFGELPEDLVAQYEEMVKEQLALNASRYGMDGATFVNLLYNADYDAFVTQNAQYSTKVILAVQALAQKEGMIAKEEDLDQRLEQLALDNGWPSLEQFLTQFDKEELRESLMYEDVAEFLLKNAKVTQQ